jgi:mannose-6-phosphate isomerase-like protein (cupin superfamily)
MAAVKDKPKRARRRLSGGEVVDAVGASAPTALPPDPLDPAVIGARVKALRESSSLSLRDLAARSGVSAPMLSQVERGETSPTLAVAARIAAGLELRLSQLLRLDESGSVTIVRASQRQHGGNGRRGHRFEVMTSGQPGQRADLSRHTLAPGGATGAEDDPPMHEPGSRETALVEEGSIVLVCDGQRHELHQGDCVTFDADLPHHFENPTDADAAFLAVVSAGLRRS